MGRKTDKMKEEKEYLNASISDVININPLWHSNTKDIDFSNQPDTFIEKYTKGFHIYKSSWADLQNAFNPLYSNLYESNDLWTEDQDPQKICKVLKHWDDGDNLIPPMLIDNGYGELLPVDGKHRLKAASILDKEMITFILSDVDLAAINKYFQPQLIS